MPNVSIKIRLGSLVLLSLLGILIVGVAGVLGIQRLSSSLDEIQQRSMPAVMLVMELQMAQVKSVLVSREGGAWNPDPYEAMANKEDAIAEVNSLFASILKRRDEADRLVEDAYRSYDALPKSAAELQQWEKVRAELASFREVYDELREVTQELGVAHDWYAVRSGLQRYQNLEYPLGNFLDRLGVEIEVLRALLREHATQVAMDANKAERMAFTYIVVATMVAGLVLLILTFLIVRGVTGPLARLRSAIERVLQTSDFRLRVTVKGRDELGQTAIAFNELLEGVQGALLRVQECSAGIAKAADETFSASAQVSVASARQSEAASAMATAIEEVTASIGDVSTSAQAVLARSHLSSNVAVQGAEAMGRVAAEMDQIAQAVAKASDNIEDVHGQSGQIASITHVIHEVAEQTNLLALNAAIEAARAGEKGRGFAVVADEVRQLAERTAQSTVEIRQMVGTMRASVSESASGMSSIVGKVGGGKRLTEIAADHILAVQQHSLQVTESITGITSALREQNLAADGLAQEVELVAQMSQENSRVAADATLVSQTLQASAVVLHEAICRFKV